MKFGLIGFPIGHSGSPELFRKMNPDGGDTYDLIEKSDFQEAYEIFLRDYDAVNVTAPFKEQALGAAAWAEPCSLRIGAANVLVKSDGIVKAYNTDYDAVRELVDRYAEPGCRAVVFGCGGAGKAAVAACLDAGLDVTLANRTVAKATAFRRRFGVSAVSVCLPRTAIAGITDFDLMIYTLPVALDELLGADLSKLTIIEANYRNPSLASARCLKYVSGHEWLEEQAHRGFSLMKGKTI